MSQHMWLLVEWVDERNVFPSYGVVSSNSLVTEDHDLHPGKMTFIRSKHGNSAKRAQILRISEDKRQVKEYKMMLERQDDQVKNMLTLCMQTIKEMKTEPLLYGSMKTSPMTDNGASGSGTAPPAIKNDDTDSESDSDITNDTKNYHINKPPVKTPAQTKRISDYFTTRNSAPANAHQMNKRQIVNSSTPLPITYEVPLLHPRDSGNSRSPPKLTFDQATQTDDTCAQVPVEKIDQIENILTRLFNQFLNLINGLQVDYQVNNSDVPAGHISDERQNRNIDQGREIREEQHMYNETAGTMQLNNSNVEVQDLRCSEKPRGLLIRRVSAHTTNDIEPNMPTDRNIIDRRNDLVPIGAGHAKVPARVLNEIDWDSYSSATRQLLQAIFPRNVLATSSLTGKKSPAFANIPAKKCLDPDLINDIIDTVSERCAVPKRSVRSSITIKCMDEAKLYRSRMQNKNRPMNLVTTKQENLENLPPSPNSHASSNGIE